MEHTKMNTTQSQICGKHSVVRVTAFKENYDKRSDSILPLEIVISIKTVIDNHDFDNSQGKSCNLAISN